MADLEAGHLFHGDHGDPHHTKEIVALKQGSLNYQFFWGDKKQCKCMLNLREFVLIVQCLGW